MSTGLRSLLAGRNSQPLTDEEVRRAYIVFNGLDNKVAVRYDETGYTKWHLAFDDEGHEFSEIAFGPDLYSGSGVLDPNSSLSVTAAAAHELMHHHRWHDKNELHEEELQLIDETLTSLGAALRYRLHLSDSDVLQLISDAMQRLKLFVEAHRSSKQQAK